MHHRLVILGSLLGFFFLIGCQSGHVNNLSLAPAAPSGATATPGNSQATVSWSAVTGATSYDLYWSTTTGVTKDNGTKIANVTSPYTQTGLTNGTTYYYVLTAI